jgi:AcrR family transcriptional regulator
MEKLETEPKNLRRKRNTISKEEILLTALKLINSHGVEKLNMRSIAKELKASVGSIYNYFENQEKIIQELLYRGEKKLYKDILNAKSETKSPKEELIKIAYAYWNFATENIELHKLMFSLGGGQHKKIFTKPNSYKEFLKSIYSFLKKNKNSKIPSEKYNSFARTVWSWMYGILVLNMAGVLEKGSASYKPIEDGMEFFMKVIDTQNI